MICDHEWKPVVGGRAMLHGEPCLVMALTSDARAEVGRVGWGLRQLVPLSDLTEHPDDARHRRLLEAARAAGKTWAATRGATKPNLQAEAMREHAAVVKTVRAIVAEIDQAEASHA